MWKPKLKTFYRQLRKAARNTYARPHPSPLFILGNEKSGTTVIAAALAAATGKSVQLDIPGTWDPIQTQLHRREIQIQQVIQKNRYDFSKDIIKEPVLTFAFDQLKAHYPKSTFILILRDPRDNIRSILNRLDLLGDLEELTDTHIQKMGALWTTWNTVVDASWLGFEQQHYIASMASRWKYIVDFYQRNTDQIILVKYEDFLADKIPFIFDLAKQSGMEAIHSIDQIVKQQFQKRGNHKVSWEDFFGAKNLRRIEEVCGIQMQQMGYEV